MRNYQTIVLTGASSGIGEALAERLGPRCQHMVLVARREKRLQALANKIKGCETHVVAADISQTESYRASLAATLKALPVPDLVILNAGMGEGRWSGKEQTPLYLKTYGVNLFGAIATLDETLPAMLATKRGHIVGVASVASYRGFPKGAAYCSSKSALWRALESLRCDVMGSGLRVSTIHPGFVETPMTEVNKSFKMPFLVPLDKATDKILRAIQKQKTHYCFPWQMRFGSYFLRCLPDWLYAMLLSK